MFWWAADLPFYPGRNSNRILSLYPPPLPPLQTTTKDAAVHEYMPRYEKRAWDAWRHSLAGGGCFSAYAEAGGEPPYTNWSHFKGRDAFIETLDYVFYGPKPSAAGAEPRVRTLATREMKSKEELAGPLPTVEEPSDHLAIAADLEVRL